MNFNKFEKSIQVSHGSLSGAWKHKRNIGSNVIEKILETYPELSAEWLIRAKGNMVKRGVEGDIGPIGNGYEDDRALVIRTLNFFGVKDRIELNEILKTRSLSLHNYGENGISPFEQLILDTWDKKYGQELKSIKHQLSSFFKDKLERERQDQKNPGRSKLSKKSS